jgi:hypothetical protein
MDGLMDDEDAGRVLDLDGRLGDDRNCVLVPVDQVGDFAGSSGITTR